jgi:hypothetical protein
VSKSTKFDSVKASRIVRIIGAVSNRTAQVRSMREALAVEFKGYPHKMLGDDVYKLVFDAATKALTASGTVGEKSIAPMAVKQAKVAQCMPVILGMNAEKLGPVADSYEKLAGLATQIIAHKGDGAKALHAYINRPKDYKKSAAAHFKALVGMAEGKFFTPKQKAVIIAAAAECKIDIA